MHNTYRIVVGIDGTDSGLRAVRWALHEAAARGGTVQAVTAWTWDGPDIPAATSPDAQRERARGILARTVDGLTVPAGVTLATESVEGRAADVLSEASRDADLLVLGSHGHGRLHQAALGSVSEACVRKATCPVVVLPVPHQAPEPALDPALLGSPSGA